MFFSKTMLPISGFIALGSFVCGNAWAQDSEQLAKQLSNPVASLISVPFQFNYDRGYGPKDGEKAFVNVQARYSIQAQRRLERHLADDPADREGHRRIIRRAPKLVINNP